MMRHKRVGSFALRLAGLTFAAAVCGATSLHGQTTKKAAPAAPAKAAAPAAPKAAPAAAAHPAGASSAAHPAGAAGATTANHSGGVTTANHGTSGGATTTNKGPMAGGGGAKAVGPTAGGAKPGGGGTTARNGFGNGGHPESVGRPGGVNHGPAPANSREFHSANGEARMRADGHPRDVHDARRGMDIHHDLGGGRHVLADRRDGGHTYYERGRPGYIGHPYSVRGHDFERRSYYYHGQAYNRYYSPYNYHGYALAVYAPARYYPVGFYGWAYNPWVNPVPYAWGFAANPWYGVYGGYFNPYPVYASPSLWLTDYLISQQLAEAYQAQQEAGAAAVAYAGPPLPPDVKQMVATEVQRQIALENSEAQQNAQQQVPDPANSGIARLLGDGQSHVFVVGKEVDVVDTAGQECAVTDGDVLQLTAPPGANDKTANVIVLSSKGGMDCKRAATVQIALDDLQDMNNQMREKLDQGLQELQAKQGQGGLPKAPPSALAAPVNAVVAENAPPPDPDGAKEIAQQAQASDVAEKEVLGGAGGGPSDASIAAPIAAPGAAPFEVSEGQTTAQVTAGWGEPSEKSKIGNKTIFNYKDKGLKVTFTNGKVTNVE